MACDGVKVTFNKTVVRESPMAITLFINFMVAAIPTPLRYPA